MPNRIIKESICTSENIDQLSTFAECTFYRLLVNCDDYGRMDARPKILASKLYPLKDVRTEQIEKALRELASAELVILYDVCGKPFLQTVTWERHQQIRAKKSKYPAPDSGAQANAETCKQMIANDSKCHRNPIQSESNPNPNPKRESNAHACACVADSPPTAEEVAEYAKANGLTLDAQRFVDFYSGKGWMVGKEPMHDWQSMVRCWVSRDRDKGTGTAQKANPALNYQQRQYTDADFNDDFYFDPIAGGYKKAGGA